MSSEQAELRDAARKLLSGSAASGPGEAWRRMVDAGWPALTAPEAFGGLEQSLQAACLLYLEIGRALSPAPLLASLLATDVLAACAASQLRDEWLERVAAGETVAVPLLAENRLGAEGGVVAAVLGAERASHALLLSEAELLVALVPLRGSLAQVASRPGWDATRALSDLQVPSLEHEGVIVLARGEAAEAALEAGSVHLHFAIAADCVGAAEAILEQTVDHLKTRRQFDRPLALFQALKHRCADLRTSISAAEALLMDYLREIDGERRGERLVLARAAKSLASATFRAVAEEAMQLHGGMSMTAEHPCHLYLKRALLNEHLASADDACDLEVGRQMMISPAC